ncbi:MAG: hypothetical protein NVSMB17_06160 [Candidatus Dormibacteria bacterium]
MTRIKRLGAAALLAFISLPLAPAASRAAAPPWHQWVGTGTGIYRDATYDRGEFIYSNGIFQARGANADLLQRHRTDYFPGGAAPTYSPPNDLYRAYTYDFFGAHRSTYNGTYHLPTDTSKWPDFTADMSELRLAIDGPDLVVRMQFTSFPRPDAQVATLAFASSSAPGTARAWPRNAGVSSPWGTALTLWGTGGAVDTVSGGQDLVAAGGAVRVTDHAFEARLPLSRLPAGAWSITGGSGLGDPANPGRYWTVPPGGATATQPGTNSTLAPGANVWDLLFSRDDPWSFDELRQADDLRSGVVSNDHQVVDPAILSSGASRAATPRLGDFSRFFSSSIGGADGIERSAGIIPVAPPAAVAGLGQLEDFDVTYHYLGKLQPYYMHVPATYPTRQAAAPLIIYLHGFTGLPDEPFYNPVGLVSMADERGYLLASALGRGDYSYRGPGDVDIKEVLADVQKHYDVDPNRVYLMGHSMGGYGTNNVAIHNPDLFAAVAPAEGTDSIALHQNLRNVPWLEMTAEEDLDTFGTNAKLLYNNLSSDGYDATLVDYKFKIHEYSSIYDTLPRIFAFFAAHRRDPNPAVVTYSRLPGEDAPGIGLVYDHAYWVSGLRPADAGKRSDTNVESLAIPHGALRPAAALRTDVTGDEMGPTGLPRTLRELFQTTPAYGTPGPLNDSAVLTLANVSAITLDLARMRLVDDCKLSLRVTSDQAVMITAGSHRLAAPAGTSTVTPGGAACTIAAGGGGLPNTGGPSLWAALLALLVAAAATGAALAVGWGRGRATRSW